MPKLTITSGVLLLFLSVLGGRAQTAPEFVTVHGHRIHVNVQGQGTPAVIFESGMGEDVSTWQPVQPVIAKSASTFSYDRSGLGLSEASTGERDGVHLATDLHDVLKAKNIPPPYVLVGHSLGGAVVQIFANRYPKEIAGLVLIDPEDGRIVHQLQARLSKEVWDERARELAKFGAMPPQVQREYDGIVQMAERIEQFDQLPRVPIVLLSGTQVNSSFPGNPVEQEIKLQLHREFLARNPQAEQILVPESRHYIQQDAPNVVINAVKHVITLTKK